ncbi:MAG TPA: hypothetical protein VIC62_01045, partial [Nakamurella sp.]
GLLATLSHRAVARVAAAAGHATAAELTRMLYAAGSLAVGPRVLAGYDPRRIDHLIASATRMSGLRHCRGEYWHVVQCNSDEDRHPVDGSAEDRPAAGGSPDRSPWVHKVYVSPKPQGLLPVLTVVADVAAGLAAHSFKVGGTAEGVHRPDKIVAYFGDEATADAAAAVLDGLLEGRSPQGVPFTGQVGDSGLVSRGLDQGGTSWRMIVCDLLGRELERAASTCGSPAEISRTALRAAADSGLDVETFWPTPLPELARMP